MERNTAKRHPEFDFTKAAALFASHGDEVSGEHITSPFHLYSVETLRQRFNLSSSGGVPTDLFVFGKGTPPVPSGTKLSGLPFWPADKPWPQDDSGEPLRFVAQLNFSDSTDLFPNLPGDLLLLFVPNDDSEDWLWEEGLIHFEWLRTRGVKPVKDFPQGVQPYAESEFYGVIHRTADYPDADVSELDVGSAHWLANLSGTKIGGVPSFIQPGDIPEGTFLVQIGSVQAAPNAKFPWTNHEAPLSLEFNERGIYGEKNQCMFSDLGSVYIFINEEGECYTRMDSH